MKQKVYVVVHYTRGYRGDIHTTICGLFKTEQAAKDHIQNDNNFDIEEYDLED